MTRLSGQGVIFQLCTNSGIPAAKINISEIRVNTHFYQMLIRRFSKFKNKHQGNYH